MTDADGAYRPVVDVHAHWLPGSALDACRRGSHWQGLQMSRTDTGLPVAEGGGRRQVFGSDLHFHGLTHRGDVVAATRVDIELLSLLPPLFRYELDAHDGAAACAANNDELAEELRDAPPGRFLGLGVVPLQDVSAAIAELRRCVEELGFVGVAVGTNVRGSRWEDPAMWDLLEAVEALGGLMFMHPSAPAGFPLPSGYYLQNVFGNPADTTLALQALAFNGGLERFPSVRIVAAHCGGYMPVSLGRMDHAWNVRPESHADTSVPPREALECVSVDTVVHSPAALRFAVDELGSDRVVLGTDFPADMGLPNPVGFVEGALGAGSDAAEAVLRGNVQRLLPSSAFALGSDDTAS